MKEQLPAGYGEPLGRGGAWARGGQFGIPYIPETMPILAHKGEALLTPAQQTLMRAGPPAVPTVRSVYITQYNTITGDYDFDRAGRRAYREFLAKLERRG